jgi:hypothetical protein
MIRWINASPWRVEPLEFGVGPSLTRESVQALDGMKELCYALPADLQLDIYVYTDDAGDALENRRLSYDRAAMIKSLLHGCNGRGARLFGEGLARSEEADDAPADRVEFTLYYRNLVAPPAE